jgi:hypothetical protein
MPSVVGGLPLSAPPGYGLPVQEYGDGAGALALPEAQAAELAANPFVQSLQVALGTPRRGRTSPAHDELIDFAEYARTRSIARSPMPQRPRIQLLFVGSELLSWRQPPTLASDSASRPTPLA